MLWLPWDRGPGGRSNNHKNGRSHGVIGVTVFLYRSFNNGSVMVSIFIWKFYLLIHTLITVPIRVMMSVTVKRANGINDSLKQEGGHGDYSVVVGCSSDQHF